MTTRKILAICKKLGISTTYYQDWGHGFYDEVEADPQTELDARIMHQVGHMQLRWYEEQLSQLAKKASLHLCPDLFKGMGLLVCDGGQGDKIWVGVTKYKRIDPVEELWQMYRAEVEAGRKMPDFKKLKNHCRGLARKHWKTFDNLPWERLTQEAIA